MKKGPAHCTVPWTSAGLYKMDENKSTGEPKQCSPSFLFQVPAMTSFSDRYPVT